MFKRDVLLAIHTFSELKSLAKSAKMRSSLKYLLIRYYICNTLFNSRSILSVNLQPLPYISHIYIPLPVNDCRILDYAWFLRVLSREGSLSCHACSDTWPRFLRFQLKDRPNLGSFDDRHRVLRTYI